MNTRRTSYLLIAAVVSALTLSPWRGGAGPQETDLEPISVERRLSPDGRFVGTLTIETVTVTDAGHLLLTGALHGTATRRTGATIQVWRQPFTVSAVPIDTERTTDVVLLKMAPITLVSVERQLTLAPIPLDIDAVPDESLLFPMFLN